MAMIVVMMNTLVTLDKDVGNQGGKGQWAVYYTSTQSFIITLFVGLTTLGTLIEFVCLCH